MAESTEDEILTALNEGSEQIEFEEALDETDSPLNQPIAENEIGHHSTPLVEESSGSVDKGEYVPPKDNPHGGLDDTETLTQETFSDGVPEQEIGSEDFNENPDNGLANENFEVPKSHAKQAADTILGITDNILTVGGGFFVKIKHHKEFYDFEVIRQIIDEQNEKNVQRLKLDEDDKVLLRPLITLMLQQKAKQLTPEQQLLGAVLSILLKKGQMVMEIKAENEILMDRILDEIREQKGYSDQDEDVETTEPEEEKTAKETDTIQEKESVQEEVETVEVIDEAIPNSVLEVLEENDTTSTEN